MKHYGKLTAAAAAGFMALNVLNVAPVFANDADTTNIENLEAPSTDTNSVNTDWDVDINKTITKDKGTAVPNENFEFQVSVPESVYPENDIPMYKEDSLISAIDVTNPTTPSTDVENVQELSVSATGGKIVVDPMAFAGKTVGIYRFIVSENNTGNVENLTYSQAQYYVDVFVTVSGNTTAATGLRVLPVADTGATDTSSKLNGMDFTNDYTKATNNGLHDLIVTKIITGNQADMSKQFGFTAVVTGQDGESFYWETSETDNKESGVVTSGGTITCKLGNNETLTVYGLSSGDSYNVEESETQETETSDGSKVTKTSDGYTVTRVDKQSDAGDATVTFTNRRQGTIPTGILMSAAPFAGLIGLGGVFAGLFFRRKRED